MNPLLKETIKEYAEEIVQRANDNPFVAIHMASLNLTGTLRAIDDDPDKEELYKIMEQVFQASGYNISITKVES